MKNKYPILWAGAIVVTTVLLVAVAFALPVSVADGGDDVETFFAVLNGGQENPATTSNALGVALLTFNEETKMLCFSISYTDLGADEIAAHFHAPASPGENAGVTIPLSPAPFDLGSPKNGCVGPLTDQQEDDLEDGLFYINIHSTEFPGGEIRGQVLRLDD